MTSKEHARSAIVHDTPVPARESEECWGSDAIAAMLRELDMPYISLVPGRELPRAARQHRQLSRQPRAADGARRSTRRTRSRSRTATAKVTDRMMAAALHANVGLMHAPMAVFNAWCDRAPMLILGATGPWDAAQAPPVDRLGPHQLRPGRADPQLHQVGQPAGLGGGGDGSAAARGADRADRAAGPGLRQPRQSRCRRRSSARCRRCRMWRATPRRSRTLPAPELVAAAAKLLSGAKNPVMLAGRCSRSLEGWNAARGARREAQRAGADQHQARRRVPDRSPPARRRRRPAACCRRRRS